MAPKTRLTLLIVALVGVVVLLLSSLYLNGLTQAKFQDVLEIAEISAEQVKTYVLQRVVTEPPAESVQEAKEAWQRLVREDQQMTPFLVRTIASSGSVVEILISDEHGKVVAASNRERLDQTIPRAADLREWSRQRTWRKLWEVLTAPPEDLELSVPLGVEATGEPVFLVRVIVSPVLVRSAVVPQVRRLAIVSLLCLVVSALAAGLLSNLAARPLEQVSRMIDLIAEGKSASELPAGPQDKEMAALQSKLSLLGEQIRGAAENASGLRGNVEQMLERLEDAVLLFDGDDRLVMAGRAAERFLGLGRWEMKGRTLDEVFVPSSPLGTVVQTSTQLRQPVKNHLLSLKQWDGSETRVLASVEVMEDFPSRQKLGTMVTLRDAESRRELESQLDVSYRREAAGRILQGVAHEIKNPLNAIHTHLQLLEMELGDEAPEIRQEIEVITRQIRMLDRMVVTLLDFTKPLELTFTDTDLAAVVKEIAVLVRPEAAKKGIDIEAGWDTETAVVRADHALLRQAVMNIVVNAIESMNRAGRVRLNVSRDGEGYVLSVSDEGSGIPPEIRDKIFNLYFTTKGRGSGIGLAMTYRVVQLHNATIDFESREGKGTTFRVRFPALSPVKGAEEQR